MSKNIKVNELEGILEKYLNEYEEDIERDVKETTDIITKEAVKEIRKTSPRRKCLRKNPYYKGWTKQVGKQNKGKYTVKIHNKTNYQLTHLLEFGHATRNGKRTKAIPHILPLEEKYSKLYEEKLITVIKRRS